MIIDNPVWDSIEHTKVYTHTTYMLCTLTRSLTPPCRHDPLIHSQFPRYVCLDVCVRASGLPAKLSQANTHTHTHAHTPCRKRTARVRARQQTVWILSGAQVRTSLGAVQSSPQQRRASTRSRHARSLALQPRTHAR